MTTSIYHTVLTFVISCLAWPIWRVANNYVLNKINEKYIPLCILIGSVISMVVIFRLTACLSHLRSNIFNVIVTFVVTCMVSIIIILESLGKVKDFVTLYLKHGEMYSNLPYGRAFVLYDAIGFHLIYYIIVFQMGNGSGWRSMSIYCGSGLAMQHSLLMFAYFVGYLPFTTCSFINLPYIIFPAYILHRAFVIKVPNHQWNHQIQRGSKLMLFDCLLVLASLTCIVIIVIKGGIVLGSDGEVTTYVLGQEPFLRYPEPDRMPDRMPDRTPDRTPDGTSDRTPDGTSDRMPDGTSDRTPDGMPDRTPDRIATFQQVIYLMYSTPIHLAVIFYLVRSTPKPQFLWDVCVLHAGIVMPGQFCYMVAALMSDSLNKFQPQATQPQATQPQATQPQATQPLFWLVNLIILIVPHLHVWRLSVHRQGRRAYDNGDLESREGHIPLRSF